MQQIPHEQIHDSFISAGSERDSLSELSFGQLDRELLDITLHTVGLVIEIGDRIVELRDRGLNTSLKADGSILSSADLEASAILERGLPLIQEGPVVTEENIHNLDLSGFDPSRPWWIADPIDSTRSYVGGYPGFCVMCSLVEDGRAKNAVVGGPAYGVVYYAMEGGGAYKLDLSTMETSRIWSQPDTQEDKLKVAVFYGNREKTLQRLEEALSVNSEAQIDLIPTSSGLKYCRLAEGEFAASAGIGYLDSWDLVPELIVREAGGRLVSSRGEGLIMSPFDTRVVRPVMLAPGVEIDPEWFKL